MSCHSNVHYSYAHNFKLPKNSKFSNLITYPFTFSWLLIVECKIWTSYHTKEIKCKSSAMWNPNFCRLDIIYLSIYTDKANVNNIKNLPE